MFSFLNRSKYPSITRIGRITLMPSDRTRVLCQLNIVSTASTELKTRPAERSRQGWHWPAARSSALPPWQAHRLQLRALCVLLLTTPPSPGVNTRRTPSDNPDHKMRVRAKAGYSSPLWKVHRTALTLTDLWRKTKQWRIYLASTAIETRLLLVNCNFTYFYTFKVHLSPQADTRISRRE